MSAENVALILRCAECEAVWLPADEERWRALAAPLPRGLPRDDDRRGDDGRLLPRCPCRGPLPGRRPDSSGHGRDSD